jgi:hypothetical protein
MGERIVYIIYSVGVQGRGRDHGYTQAHKTKTRGVDDGTKACVGSLSYSLYIDVGCIPEVGRFPLQ